MIAIQLLLFAAVASESRSEFPAAYTEAIKLCVALAPGNEKDLGTVDPDDVAFWFRAARLEASKTFWNDAGRKWLREHRPEAIDSDEAACSNQLSREAEKETEEGVVFFRVAPHRN